MYFDCIIPNACPENKPLIFVGQNAIISLFFIIILAFCPTVLKRSNSAHAII